MFYTKRLLFPQMACEAWGELMEPLGHRGWDPESVLLEWGRSWIQLN